MKKKLCNSKTGDQINYSINIFSLKKHIVSAIAASFISLLFSSSLFAQSNTSWNGKACSVVLTYDDALDVDLDHAIPALDSLGLKGTFYLSGYSGALSKRKNEWRTISAHGHELGNHTFYHPCIGNIPGREWVSPAQDLSKYSIAKMVIEIKMTDSLLATIDGKTKRTFAYPCGDIKIGDSAYLNQDEFVAARGVKPGMPLLPEVHLFDIDCYGINGQSGNELIALVKAAQQKKALVVFLFHGVGGGHSLNVSLEAHSALLHYLKANEKDIWIAPMIEVAEFIKSHQ